MLIHPSAVSDLSADPDAERGVLTVGERAAAWFQPRPGELLGLAVLVLGAVVATLLWWQQAATGPGGIAEVAAAGVTIAEDGQAAGAAPGVTPQVGTDPAPAPSGGAGPAGGGAPASMLTVYVTGAVRTPGLVTLPAGARVGDAVLAAGGTTTDADPARANLARLVTDGEHVHLPAVGETLLAPIPGSDPGPGSDAPGSAGSGLIDLNTADAAALETLPGIGPARAAAIVEHRTRHGPFGVPGDLRDVAGIGEATFQRLSSHVVVR